jgi:hypothetical protein
MQNPPCRTSPRSIQGNGNHERTFAFSNTIVAPREWEDFAMEWWLFEPNGVFEFSDEDARAAGLFAKLELTYSGVLNIARFIFNFARG